MNFEELQNVWQSGPPAGTAPTVDPRLLTAVRRRSRQFSRLIFWRDVREVAASGLVAVVFGRIALAAQAEGARAWPAWIAALLPLAVAGFLLIDRWLTRRRTDPAGESVALELARAAAAVRHQIWLLRHVQWWYLLPLALSGAALELQLLLYAPLPLPPVVKWIGALLLFAVIGAVHGAVWWLNQRAIRIDLEPRLAEIEARRRELLTGE